MHRRIDSTAITCRANGRPYGGQRCRDAPTVTNLLFVDDSLILMKANVQNAACLKSILDLYCVASRQLVSVDKSSKVLCPSNKVNMKAEVCSYLNIITEALNDKYLGPPATLGLDKSDCFKYLIDRLILKLTGWKEKYLSSGGKGVLIKYVAQAILTYVMSLFKFPKKSLQRNHRGYTRFWWGDDTHVQPKEQRWHGF